MNDLKFSVEKKNDNEEEAVPLRDEELLDTLPANGQALAASMHSAFVKNSIRVNIGCNKK